MTGPAADALTTQEIRRLERDSSRWLDDARARLRAGHRPAAPRAREERSDG